MRLLIVLFVLMGIIGVVFVAQKKDLLKKYHQKRDFSKTSEPKGGKRKKSKKPIFVIQKHAASHLHYDFRVEIDDVLKSWAVPKGPSTDPKIKRLAMQTEDHPLEYAQFEGVIPEGEYGGGTVMVWDSGTYENIKKDKKDNLVPIEQCYKQGTVEIFLKGKKLHGGYALIRTGADKKWLLIKMRDEYADARRNPVNTQQKSVLTGRTMKQIEKEEK